MACRDIGKVVLSRVIDAGPAEESMASSCNLVSSPSATKSGTAPRISFSSIALTFDMALNVCHLLRPPISVPVERFVTAIGRYLVEPGLNHRKKRTF